MRPKIKSMTDEEREEYIQSLSEQERLQLFILDEITRLHVEVARVDRRLLKVLATMKNTSIVQEGTEAVYEELPLPIYQSHYRSVAMVAKEDYHLDQVAAYLYLGEPEKPKASRKKRRSKRAKSGDGKKT